MKAPPIEVLMVKIAPIIVKTSPEYFWDQLMIQQEFFTTKPLTSSTALTFCKTHFYSVLFSLSVIGQLNKIECIPTHIFHCVIFYLDNFRTANFNVEYCMNIICFFF